MKKALALLLAATMTAGVLAGCGGGNNDTTSGGGGSSTTGGGMEGAHVFMFKSAGNHFGELMYDGFEAYIKAQGGTAQEKSPAQPTVADQVKLIEECVTQKIASLTISANSDTGYDEVFKKCEEAGIKVVSVDSEIAPEFRITHINQASSADVGAYLVRSATLIALGKEYSEDMEEDGMEAAVTEALSSYSGDELKFGVLSAAVDTPVQNGWIADMEKELSKDMYKGKVSAELDKKYGNDDPTISTTQANAFVSENKVDVIISPTTVGISAAGATLSTANVDIKLTGLGLPSEMSKYCPQSKDDNASEFVCPWMMLWDVVDQGAMAAAAAYAAVKDGYTGEEGSTFVKAAYSVDINGTKLDYDEVTYTTEAAPSGDGTIATLGAPTVWWKGNMETYSFL